MSDTEPKEEVEEVDVLEPSPIEFSEMFFAAIDESIEERLHRTGGRFPDWDRAVARAKLEGVVPLKGSGSRVMATIPHRGLTIEDCSPGCPFRVCACLCSQYKEDWCSHPMAPENMELPYLEGDPPKDCPLRSGTFHLALDMKWFEEK